MPATDSIEDSTYSLWDPQTGKQSRVGRSTRRIRRLRTRRKKTMSDTDKPRKPPLKVVPENPAQADQRARDRELTKKAAEEDKKRRDRESYQSRISDILEKPLRLVTTDQIFCWGECPGDGFHWCYQIILNAWGKIDNCSRSAGRSIYCHQHRKNHSNDYY